jgi:DNA-directed RNA polymerase specialized sigma24 family protein
MKPRWSIASMAAADENDLLQLIETIQSARDAAAVDTAIRLLEPLIRDTARRACCYRRPSNQLARDFVEDALAAIVAPRPLAGRTTARIASYQPSGGPFSGWLWRTLDRLLIDRIREAARRSKHELASAASRRAEAANYDVDPNELMGTDEPFGDADLQRIESWRPLDRIRLLSAARLWTKVPVAFWEKWCAEADIECPFPPPHSEDEPLDHWLAVLADAMLQSRAALHQHWYRKRKLLADLDYVRELREEG